MSWLRQIRDSLNAPSTRSATSLSPGVESPDLSQLREVEPDEYEVVESAGVGASQGCSVGAAPLDHCVSEGPAVCSGADQSDPCVRYGPPIDLA